MGVVLTEPTRYRRTPEAGPTGPPGRLPSGRRLVTVVVGLVVLAAIVVAIVVLGDDEDDVDVAEPTTEATEAPATTAAPDGDGTTATTDGFGGDAPDEVVAREVLPATLGPEWVDVVRERTPVPAELDPADACAAVAQPIQTGLVVRLSQDRLVEGAVAEKAALVGGVVEEGTEVPTLDDPEVVECFREGLEPQLAEGTELVLGEQPTPDAPEGAELSGVRFDVVDAEGQPGARFDLLLLRRDRAVSFLLDAVLVPEDAAPLEELVEALDDALEPAASRLN